MDTNESPKPKITFYLLSKNAPDLTRDFQQLIFDLKELWTMNVIQTSPHEATISNNLGYSSELILMTDPNPFLDQGFELCARLMLHPEDEVTLTAIRGMLSNPRSKYKLYNGAHRCFVPIDPTLLVDDVGTYNIKTFKTLEQFGLRPVYFHQKEKVYYALNTNNEVEIVNPGLLNFVFDKSIPEKQIDELSYVVAPSMSMFSGMFDKGLVPTKFYQYFNRPMKIINNSYFDLDNAGRKVFIKPFVFEFDEEHDEFFTFAGEGTSLLHMDKILPGETLDTTTLRILNQELKIADDYIGAMVGEYVEFDRDKEGVITPRLLVNIYVDHINNREWAERMSQTSWRKKNGGLASSPPSDS